MVKLEIEFSDMEYDALMEKLMPYLEEHLRTSGNPLGMLLSNGMAGRLFSSLSQSQKDAMVCELINTSSGKMARKAEAKAAAHNIHLKVNSIHASTR